MELTTISSKYQVVIPREIRKQFGLKPGQKVMFLSFFRTIIGMVLNFLENSCTINLID